MERWIEISEFSGYSVSDHGWVRNDYSGKVLALLRNQKGHTHVGMVKRGVQYKRAVGRLVADVFVPKNHHDHFNTVLHLDDDRSNNHYTNLMWRPKWFVDSYTKQFRVRSVPIVGMPIRDIATGEIYKNSWHAVMTHGILDFAIFKSIVEGDGCFPTYQRFELA